MLNVFKYTLKYNNEIKLKKVMLGKSTWDLSITYGEGFKRKLEDIMIM